MEASTVPDMVQEKVHSLIEGLEQARCYLEDMIMPSNGSRIHHIEK